jgi:AGZA family xanthine/uracil permease-like MFS transporter
VPALAQLAMIFIDKLLPYVPPGVLIENAGLVAQAQTVRMLASGFIVTSLLWASALAATIDRRLRRAGVFFAMCAALTLFGVIHSPAPGSPIFVPWQLDANYQSAVFQYASGYGLAAVLLLAWDVLATMKGVRPIEVDDVLVPGDHTDGA